MLKALKMSEAHKGQKAWNKGISPSKETIEKISGSNSSNWKEGIWTILFEEGYNMTYPEWKKLAQEIRIRDRFICQYCGASRSTQVHHVIPRRIKVDNSPGNLITLCKSCHNKIERLTNKYLIENKDPMEIFYEKWSSISCFSNENESPIKIKVSSNIIAAIGGGIPVE